MRGRKREMLFLVFSGSLFIKTSFIFLFKVGVSWKGGGVIVCFCERMYACMRTRICEYEAFLI